MAITATQTPSAPFDMAYGANPITLTGLTTLEDKYVLQIYLVGASTPIADIRQSPNKNGKAIFDIQNILQNIIEPSRDNIDALNYNQPPGNQRLRIIRGEVNRYVVLANFESDGVVDPVNEVNIGTFTVMGGTKQYWEVPYDPTPYIVGIEGDDSNPACTVINNYAKALSDNQWTISDSQTGDSFNIEYSSPGGIDVHNVYLDDQCTKSFWNPVDRTAAIQAATQAQGIEGFWILQVNSSGTIFNTSFIGNTQSNGGGPNTVVSQGVTPTGNYNVVTIASGPANLPVTLSPSCTHYYIVPIVYTPTECSGSVDPYMKDAAWRAQRYNILDEKCNDYSHIQFAWMNSLGFRDQFTFTKRNERIVNMSRNQYLKEAADFNSNSYSVDVQDRGYTTFSQKLEEVYEVQSDFMNDQEAKTLESLFISAQPMVRLTEGPLANQWLPIQLISSNYIERTNRKDKLFQYTIRFRIAHNIKSQRG